MNPESRASRLLLVEDDAQLASMVSDFLAENDFQVSIEQDGQRAAQRILAEEFDVLVLNIGLPGMDGISICRTVRAEFPGPIVMLTARGDEIDEVVAIEVGADDYIAKPVRPRALLARFYIGVLAVLRRAISNLTRNAARFAHSKITFSTGRTHSADPGGDLVHIRVDDDGPGIPEEDRERIFQPFVRLGDASDGGSGLGLALVHRIVVGQGGQVKVGTSPSSGARFEITLSDHPVQKLQPTPLTAGASA